MKVPDIFVGKRFFVGEGNPEILGRGPTEVRGSAYVEGPQITGDPSGFNNPNPYELGNMMCGQNKNIEMKPIPFYSLFVRTFARISSFLKVDTLLNVKLIRSKVIYAEVIMANVKNFVIPHPQKENKKLVYSCLEGPENSVYIRGVLKNEDVINLPEVWKDLVEEKSITVSLTPVQNHQDIIVKEIKNNQVIIETNSKFPVHCFYHIFAERKDIPKLITEIDIK